MHRLVTERLFLRQWRPSDCAPFADINASEQVMRYFPSTRSRTESDQQVARFQASIDARGWGFWAAELRESGQFAGFIGIEEVGSDLPFSPAVEIGWRLAEDVWGQGLAPEGARACLRYAFQTLELARVVSMAPLHNLPSIAVMKKIGMSDSGNNFSHPNIQSGHLLEEHALYTIKRADWLATNQLENIDEINNAN